MKILVANLGSTSFKYRLFDMADERVLARGGVERIGSAESRCFVEAAGAKGRADGPGARSRRGRAAVPASVDRPKQVSAEARANWPPSASRRSMRRASPACSALTPGVLAAMEAYADVAPAHNPPYVKAMRLLAEELPRDPAGRGVRDRLSRDHRRRPKSSTPCPLEWAEKHGIKRWGFHGASHRYIAGTNGQAAGQAARRRIISCHLGGSSSLCAIRDGKSVGDEHGHESADRACRTTTASAISTCSPCRP